MDLSSERPTIVVSRLDPSDSTVYRARGERARRQPRSIGAVGWLVGPSKRVLIAFPAPSPYGERRFLATTSGPSPSPGRTTLFRECGRVLERESLL
jgi:hypothetical protein